MKNSRYDEYEIYAEEELDIEIYGFNYYKHVFYNKDCNHDCYRCEHKCDNYDYYIGN